MNKQASLLLESLSRLTTHEEPLQNAKSLQTGMKALNEFLEIRKISPNKISNKEVMVSLVFLFFVIFTFQQSTYGKRPLSII